MDKAFVVWYINSFRMEYGVFESVADIETFLGEKVAIWVPKGQARKKNVKSYFEPGDQHYPQYPIQYAAVEVPVRKSGDLVEVVLGGDWVQPPIGQR